MLGISRAALVDEPSREPLHPFPAITMSVCNLRPDSVGSCHVTSLDHTVQPDIRPSYLSTETDKHVAAGSIRQVRMVMGARALRAYAPEELLPGPGVQTDEELLHEAGNIATKIFHPVGTCRMGVEDHAVVDPRLRLRGLAGLRVVDASIMPRIVSGKRASPVVMIAEKAADMIRSDARA